MRNSGLEKELRERKKGHWQVPLDQSGKRTQTTDRRNNQRPSSESGGGEESVVTPQKNPSRLHEISTTKRRKKGKEWKGKWIFFPLQTGRTAYDREEIQGCRNKRRLVRFTG